MLAQQHSTSACRPSPVVAETERSAGPGGGPRSALAWMRIAPGGRLGGIAEPEHQIGRLERRAGAADADRLDLVARIAQAGGVDQQERAAADRDRRLDQVAGGAGDRPR